VNEKGAEQHGMTNVGRDAEGEKRDQSRLPCRIMGGLRAATLPIAPVPKRSVPGETPLQRGRKMKVGMMARSRAGMPRRNRSTVPRAMGAGDIFQSCRVGKEPLMRVSEDLPCATPRSILRSTSLHPEDPMMMGTSPNPSPEGHAPKVKAWGGRGWSSPTVPGACRGGPWPRPQLRPAVRYVTIGEAQERSAKISGGPKRRPTEVSGGAKQHDPEHAECSSDDDPKAAMPSAGPARPWRAIW